MPFRLVARVVTGVVVACAMTAFAQPVPPMEPQQITRPDDTSIRITRTFEAPRERVFAALTEAPHLRRWMKGRDIALESVDVDLRPGGSTYLVYVRSNGRRLEVVDTYQDVEAPSRFVYVETYGFSPLRIVVTTTLDPVPGGTRFTQTVRYASTKERDDDYPGVAESAEAAFAGLASYLKTWP